MDCSPPVSSLRGISQARILEWVAISFSRGSSWYKNRICIICLSRLILYHWAILIVYRSGFKISKFRKQKFTELTYNGILLSHKKQCIWVNANEVDKPWTYYAEKSLSQKVIMYDGWVEGCVLTFSCENTKIMTISCTTINRRMLDPTKKR